MTPDPMNLDERARRAAASINTAVDRADLQLFTAGIPAVRPVEDSSHRFGSGRWVTVAGSFAAIFIIVGLAVLPGRLFAPDNDVATTAPSTPESSEETPTPNPDGETPPPTTATVQEPTTTASTAPTTTTIALDTTAPELSVNSPKDGATVTKGTIQFRGVTEPGSRVIAAGQWDADVDEEGNWEIILGLNSGSNIATFTAIDDAGNETTVQISVYYDPPSPTTTVPVVEFSANAQFETCVEIPPYNVYWGTAAPGTKISITSEFGSGIVYAGENGGWEIVVEFPEVPFGEEFLVTVSHPESGQSQGFGFTSLAD